GHAVNTGDPPVGALLQLNGDTLGEGFRIDLAVPTLDQELRPFPQLARGFARHWVFDHHPTLRAGGVTGNAALAQGQGVGDDDVRPERDIGRVAGECAVEFRL